MKTLWLLLIGCLLITSSFTLTLSHACYPGAQLEQAGQGGDQGGDDQVESGNGGNGNEGGHGSGQLPEKFNEILEKLNEKIQSLEAALEKGKGGHGVTLEEVLEHIKKNGIHLGNRWRIAEEGTGSYEALVFRDLTTTNAGTDRRYAMFKERYVDL